MIGLSDNIKRLRAVSGLTQALLAQRAGVTKATISAYEGGSRLPSYEVLIRLARIFGTTTDELLGIGKQSTLNVTGLTDKQLASVQELVLTYKNYNNLLQNKPLECESALDKHSEA